MSGCRLTWLIECDAAGDGDEARLQALLDTCLAEHELDEAALTILLIDDAESARLHGEHFDDPTSTDVMTFPDGASDPDSGLVHLGDLAVNAALAARLGPQQHPGSDQPAADELTLYILHGLLHLLGYDDRHDVARQRMWDAQRRLLSSVGISIAAEPQ